VGQHDPSASRSSGAGSKVDDRRRLVQSLEDGDPRLAGSKRQVEPDYSGDASQDHDADEDVGSTPQSGGQGKPHPFVRLSHKMMVL